MYIYTYVEVCIFSLNPYLTPVTNTSPLPYFRGKSCSKLEETLVLHLYILQISKMGPRWLKGISARQDGYRVTLEGRRKPKLPDFWPSTVSKGP